MCDMTNIKFIYVYANIVIIDRTAFPRNNKVISI